MQYLNLANTFADSEYLFGSLECNFKRMVLGLVLSPRVYISKALDTGNILVNRFTYVYLTDF